MFNFFQEKPKQTNKPTGTTTTTATFNIEGILMIHKAISQ